MPIMEPPVPNSAKAFIRYHNLSGGPACAMTMGVELFGPWDETIIILIASQIAAAVITDLASYNTNMFFDVCEVLAQDGSGIHASAAISSQGTLAGVSVDPTQCKCVVNYPSSTHKLIAKLFVPGQVQADYAANPNTWFGGVATRAINSAFVIASACVTSSSGPGIVSHAWLETVTVIPGSYYVKDLRINHQTRRGSS